ncbi:MAG: energy transducer TonB family protein [Stellaceae bacterium]
MFRIDVPIDEGRSEPLFGSGAAVGGLPRLSLSRAPLPIGAEAGREPFLPEAPDPARRPARPEPARPVASIQRRRPFGPVGSLLLHLLPLLLLVNWPMHPPTEVTPIPVQLVFQPPPPPPPARRVPQPRPRPEAIPPRGRIASETMGDTRTRGRDAADSERAAPRKPPAAAAAPRLEAPQETAFLPPPPVLPAPPALTLAKPPELRRLPAPKPQRKPASSAHEPVRRVPQWGRLTARPAHIPGPAATRDEYLAYLAYLARRHIGLLSRSLIGDRRGETVIDVLVLDDGTVALLSVGQSSGYPDIDLRVEQMIRAVGRFPPLPQWFQGASMQLEFRLEFPEALEED